MKIASFLHLQIVIARKDNEANNGNNTFIIVFSLNDKHLKYYFKHPEKKRQMIRTKQVSDSRASCVLLMYFRNQRSTSFLIH